MSLFFIPDTEIPEGWRATPLGAVACFVGMHQGRLVDHRPENGTTPLWVTCARCRRLYPVRHDSDLSSGQYLIKGRPHLVNTDGTYTIVDGYIPLPYK